MNETVEEIRCLLNFHWDAGRQGIEICPCIKFRLPLHAHTCPLYNVLLEVVCCAFPRNKLFTNMPMFVASQSFISLPSFMFVSAVVSEIRDLKKEKEKEKNSEMGLFPI